MQIQTPTSDQRQVRFFRNGRNQAIRIPREFELPRDEAALCREGKRFIIEAKPVGSLLSFLESCKSLDVDFPDIDDLPPLCDVRLPALSG